jgi:pSer/pThr/pTyr-binding forkhead associated (FHA) protein
MSQIPVKRPDGDDRPESGFRGRAPSRISLRYRGHDLVLGKPELTIGRGAECDVTLSSGLVSRRHARLRVDGDGVTIEDLQSRNGVYVNGEMVRETRLLEIGDRIDIGGEELELVELFDTELARSRETQMKRRAPKPTPDPEAHTRQASAFVLLGGLLDKLLALGRGAEAERVMSGHLERMLEEAERGRRPEGFTTAGHYAIRLAEATGRVSWVNYAIRLYLALREPMPTPQIDALHAVVRRTRNVDVLRLREYVAALRDRASELGPAERFALRRIESLADVAAL